MKNKAHTFSMTPSPDQAELEMVRDDYLSRGEDFEFVLTANPRTGYFIEPWSNECLTGDELAPSQPKPVSLDQSGDEIAEQEQAIREWIGSKAHQLVVDDAAKRAPPGWKLKSHLYDGAWPETEFGASVLFFSIN